MNYLLGIYTSAALYCANAQPTFIKEYVIEVLYSKEFPYHLKYVLTKSLEQK